MKYFLSLFFSLFCFASSLRCEVVVCLHGFLRGEKCMSMIASSLKKEGCEVFNWTYPSREKSIESHAKDLVLFLNQIVVLYPNDSIDFVTHSLGGIILRCALNTEGCPSQAKIGKAVLIAPPNQGSSFARFLSHFGLFHWILGPYAGRELLQAKDFSHFGEFPPSMKILVISGKLGLNPAASGLNDGKVGIKESCLSTPHDHLKVWASHSWICYSPTVIRMTKDFLLDLLRN